MQPEREVQFLEAAYTRLQDYVLSMRSGLGKKIATQGLQKMEKQLEKLRSKEHSGAHKEFDPEAATDQKRAWLEAQEQARGKEQLASWPQHLIDHFFVVGLPPDVEVTQIAGDLLEKERRQRDSDTHGQAHRGGGTDAGSGPVREPLKAHHHHSYHPHSFHPHSHHPHNHHEEWAAHDSIRMLRGGAAVPVPVPHPQQQAPSAQPRYDKVPAPAYPPQILFRYPHGTAPPIRDREVCDLCFPHQVPPRRIRRSPSWSALDEVVFGRHAPNKDDQAFVFMLKAGGNLPLYGICMYSEEVLHRPPVLARERYSNCKAPYRQCLIAAPRCYCILSQYPFFPLHFQVLNIILSMERLHRIVEFSAEVSCNAAGALEVALPGAGKAAGAAKDHEVTSPTERLASGDPTPLHHTLAPDTMAARVPSVSSQEQWQQQCSDTMRHLAQRIMDPQLSAHDAPGRGGAQEVSLSKHSLGSLVAKSRPSEVWEGLAHMLGVKHPVPEMPPGSAPPVRIDAPLVKAPSVFISAPNMQQEQQQQQQQEQQSQRVSLVQQMLEDALMATASKDELGSEQRGAPQSGAAAGSAPTAQLAAVRSVPLDVTAPHGGGSGRFPVHRATRKYTRLLGARSLGHEYRAVDLLRRPACFSHQAVSVLDDDPRSARPRCSPGAPPPAPTHNAPTDPQQQQQQQDGTSSPRTPLPLALQAQASAAMDVGRFLLASDMEAFEDAQGDDAAECMSRSWPASSGTPLPKNPTTPTPRCRNPAPPPPSVPLHPTHASSGSVNCSAAQAEGGPAAGPDLIATCDVAATPARPLAHANGHASPLQGPGHCCAPDRQQPQPPQLGFSHTRTVGFGAQQSSTRVHADGTAVASGAHAQGSCPSPPLHPCTGALPPLGTPPDRQQDSQAWDADSNPARAYQGEDYEQHLRCLLAHQASPSAVEEPLRQHLRELLSRQADSPMATRARGGSVPTGVYDSCTSATAVGQEPGDESGCSTCFATPEVKPAATGCGAEEEDGEGQQGRSHSSTQAQAATPPSTLRFHRSLSSNGSLLEFATPAVAFPPDGHRPGASGQALAAAGAAHPPRAPVRGALTKRLQQASPRSSGTNTIIASPSSTAGGPQHSASKPAGRLRSQEMMAAQHHHTRSFSGASFHTAVECGEEEEGQPGRGAGEAEEQPQEGRRGAGGYGSGGGGGSTPGVKGGRRASGFNVEDGMGAHQQQQQQQLEEEGKGKGEEGTDTLFKRSSASDALLPRMDTPPALPCSPLWRSSTGRSHGSSSAASSCMELGGRRKGGTGVGEGGGLDASQFSSLAVLDTLYHAPLVHPGDCLHFSLGGVNTLAYWRPLLPRRAHILGPLHQLASYADEELATELSSWAAAALIRALPLEDLLMLLSAALLEQQLVFFCPNISLLSACVLGLLPLLRPYAWHGLLMPVTPGSMVCFLEAPVPFVLGWQYKTHDVSTRCTSLVRVNVYKGHVSNASHLPCLPGHKKLAAALAPHHARVRAAGAAAGAGTRPVHVLTPEEERATKSFLDVLSLHLGGGTGATGSNSPGNQGSSCGNGACLLGDLRPYFITNVSGNTRTATLMKDWVIEATPSRDRPFVRTFLETQMFQVHSDRVMASLCEGRVV